jgi:hypothetical protein
MREFHMVEGNAAMNSTLNCSINGGSLSGMIQYMRVWSGILMDIFNFLSQK